MRQEYEHGGCFRCGRLAWGRAERTLYFIAAEHGVQVRINSADGLLFVNVDFDFIGDKVRVEAAVDDLVSRFGEVA